MNRNAEGLNVALLRSDEPPQHRAQQVSRELLRSVERHASMLRKQAGILPDDRLDPIGLAERFGLFIVSLADLAGLTPEDRQRLAKIDARQWSGAGLPLDDGRTIVILNPRQTPERAAVTVMEEVAHIHLGHKPTRISPSEGGLMKREYDPRMEQEAYWTAAATLLPSRVVAGAVWKGQSAAAIASRYGVSVELTEFRIKILSLWNRYKESRDREGVS
jgi:hypothetical protein